jgi:hypothetical protein
VHAAAADVGRARLAGMDVTTSPGEVRRISVIFRTPLDDRLTAEKT